MRFFRSLTQSFFNHFPFVGRIFRSAFILRLKRNKTQLEMIAECLNKIGTHRLVYIDVGCYDGGFFRAFRQNILPTKSILAIGIDPVNRNHRIQFSVFLQAAVSNGEEGYRDFYIYNAPECNSLKEMRVEHATHLLDENKDKWLIAREIVTLTAVEKVYNLHLSSVIELLGLKEAIIHYVKIDAQGSDLDVFKSLGKYADNVLFVQVESIVSRDQNARLYKHQSLLAEDRTTFEKAGFELFHVQSGSKDMLPEADVVYVNQRLSKDLLGEIGAHSYA